MSKGLKVGTNIATNTDDQLVYSSEWNNWKIAQTGTFSLALPSTMATQTQVISHTLGYAPAVEVWATFDNQSVLTPGYWFSATDIMDGCVFDFTISSSQVVVYAQNYGDYNKTVSFRYIIYYERIDA